MAIVKAEEGNVCFSCDTGLAEESLKCRTCQRLLHFGCSGLPDYHLARLAMHRASTYSCRVCIGSEDKFSEAIAKVKRILDSEAQLIVDTANLRPTQELATSQVGLGTGVSDSGVMTVNGIANGNSGNGDHVGTADVGQENQEPTLGENNERTSQQNTGNLRRHAEDVCPLYIQKKCTKGKSGKVGGHCPLKHPKICFRFINFGTKRDGCNRGSGCKFYHPKVCYQFDKRGKCNRLGCTFYHAKKRLQKSQGPSRVNPHEYGARSHEMPFGESTIQHNSYAGVAASRPCTRKDGATRQYSPLHEETRTAQHNQASGFLEFQTQVQEQIKQLSQMMEILVSRDACMTNATPTRQRTCHCSNRS